MIIVSLVDTQDDVVTLWLFPVVLVSRGTTQQVNRSSVRYAFQAPWHNIYTILLYFCILQQTILTIDIAYPWRCSNPL